MKDRLTDLLWFLIAAVIGAAVALWVDRRKPTEGPETVVITQIDTLVVRDTITAYKPVPFNVYVVDTMYVPVPVPGKKDTVWAQLPREAKTYQDSTYKISISGYLPSLDSVSIYQRTLYIDKTQTVYIEPSRWSLGVQAGYGASKDGLSPYIGLGVQYRLLPLKKGHQKRSL